MLGLFKTVACALHPNHDIIAQLMLLANLELAMAMLATLCKKVRDLEDTIQCCSETCGF